MASLSSYDDSATEAIDLGARLKVIEDQVRGELERAISCTGWWPTSI